MKTQTFLKIQNNRILATSIKRYRPVEDTKIDVYYSVSRTKLEKETYTFSTNSYRNEALRKLDEYFLNIKDQSHVTVIVKGSELINVVGSAESIK